MCIRPCYAMKYFLARTSIFPGKYAKFSAVRFLTICKLLFSIPDPHHRERHMATKSKASKKPSTKSEILGHISDKTGLKRKEVSAVFDELTTLLQPDLNCSGLFTG